MYIKVLQFSIETRTKNITQITSMNEHICTSNILSKYRYIEKVGIWVDNNTNIDKI